MPELPEVESARRNLSLWLCGKTLLRVTAPNTRVLRPSTPARVARALRGGKVVAVERKGKWLRVGLESGVHLYSHLGMSGRWVERKTAAATEKHERFRIDVARTSVRYIDPRLFGRLLVRGPSETLPAWDELGPDPLVDGLDVPALAARLASVGRSIKETLLDQRLFAGVGNIQATEALWRAKLAPTRAASSLSTRELRALVRAIDASIHETLRRDQGPEITYVDDAGAPNPFRVYGKSKTPCPRCRTVLARIVQGGRATVYCPRCQIR